MSKRPTKAEIVEYCYQSIVKSWELHPGPKDFDKRRNDFLDCKSYVIKQGYEEETFNILWEKACDKFSRKL